MLLISAAFEHQRQNQWVLPLPKQPKPLLAPLDVSILSASHLRHRPMPPPRPLLQQANLQLQVQLCILDRRPATHVMNPSTSTPLTPILHDPFVLLAQCSRAQLSPTHQPSIPHHLHHLKALKAPQISHIRRSSPTLARILL